MAYESKEWVCGETITADGLNNIEDGIQEALECCEGVDSKFFIVDMVSQDGETFTASQPKGDILSAISDGKAVLARYKWMMGNTVAVGGTAAIRFWMGGYSAIIDIGDDGSGLAWVKYLCNKPADDDYTWTVKPAQ